MSATAPRPASSGTHAQNAVFRQRGWLPEHSGIPDLDALRAEHERDVAAWERAQAAVNRRASEHRANEQAVADSARRRAAGEDGPTVKPLPEAARQTELALARAEADAARDVLDRRNDERCAVIEEHRDEWEQTWKGVLGTDQAAIDELQAQIAALRERQRLSAVFGWRTPPTAASRRDGRPWSTACPRASARPSPSPTAPSRSTRCSTSRCAALSAASRRRRSCCDGPVRTSTRATRTTTSRPRTTPPSGSP